MMGEAFRFRNAVLMIVLLVVGTTGCASKKQSPDEELKQAFSDVRAEIQSVVTDPQRASKAEDLITELEQEFISIGETVKTRRAKFIQTYANYDSTRADIDAALDAVLSAARSNQVEVSRIQRELADILNAEEWDAIEKKHSKALGTAIRNIRRSI